MASLLPDLNEALHAIQSTRYAHLTSGTIIVYDYLLTFGEEVELIWNHNWSLGKMLFIINRYYFLFSVVVNMYGLWSDNLNDSFCLRFFQWQGWTGLFACMIAEAILQIRLYALYFLNKRVLTVMVTCFVLAMATSATIMGVVLSRITVVYIPGVTFCVPFGVPDYFFIFWIPILCFESLLCCLALFRGFQAMQVRGGLFQSGRHLVTILIRDSIIYFLVMFLTYLTNLLVWTIGPADLIEIPIGFSVALSCVLGNRLILNIRRANQDLVSFESGDDSDAGDLSSGGVHIRPHPDDINITTSIFTPSELHHHHRPSSPSLLPLSFAREGGHLSDIEMTQLRSLRAAPRSERSLVMVI